MECKSVYVSSVIMYILDRVTGGDNTQIQQDWDSHATMKLERRKVIASAVAALVESKDYRTLKSQLLRMIEQHAVLPTRFAGDLEILNALVELGVEHPLQFEQVFSIITARRRERALYYEEQRRSKRNDYMKKYMRTYRAQQKHQLSGSVKTVLKKKASEKPRPKRGGVDQEIDKILGD